MAYTNSSLICYKKLSPSYNPRNHAIDTISIHCMAGNLSIESCGAMFAIAKNSVSSNYGIGSDGRIALYVEEENRSWCTSSRPNDHRAITIEVASGSKPPYTISDKAYASLVKLCTDICRRNGIKMLLWKGDESLIGQVDKQNMTVHRWFANKACPGDHLYSLHSKIADEVNKNLGVANSATTTKPSTTTPEDSSTVKTSFQVQVLDDSLNIRKGAGTQYDIVGQIKDHGIYTITETKGTVGNSGSWGKLKSGAGWISLASCYVKKVSSSAVVASSSFQVKIVTKSLNIRKGAGTTYAKVGTITDGGIYTITETKGTVGKAGSWGKLKSGAGWISLNSCYAKKI